MMTAEIRTLLHPQRRSRLRSHKAIAIVADTDDALCTLEGLDCSKGGGVKGTIRKDAVRQVTLGDEIVLESAYACPRVAEREGCGGRGWLILY